MRLLKKLMEKKGLFAKTERTLQEHMEIMQIPDEEVIGAIYLELQTMPDNKNAEVIRAVIEEYHFLPDEEKKRAIIRRQSPRRSRRNIRKVHRFVRVRKQYFWIF